MKECRETWILFYDGACPICFRSKTWINKNLNSEIRLTVVDLNSEVAKNRGYSSHEPILETPNGVFRGFDVVWQTLGKTKFKGFKNPIFKPVLKCLYWLFTALRKIIQWFVKRVL